MNKTFGAKKNPLQRFCTHAITILCVMEIPEIPGFGGTAIHWKHCNFQDLGALKDCKAIGGGHASARQKVRGREGGREVEARVMQEKILRQLIFDASANSSRSRIIILCSCNF